MGFNNGYDSGYDDAKREFAEERAALERRIAELEASEGSSGGDNADRTAQADGDLLGRR